MAEAVEVAEAEGEGAGVAAEVLAAVAAGLSEVAAPGPSLA